MDHSDDIVVLLEANAAPGSGDAVVISVNGAFLRAAGYAEREIIGRTTTELFPVAAQVANVMQAIRDRATLRGELECGRQGGGGFMFGYHLMPAPERTPGRCCFAILGRDITALLEARQVQNSIQRLLAKVFVSVDDAVVIVNAAGRILMANPRTDQLLGYKTNELVGRRSLDVVAPDSRASIGETIQKQMRDGTDQRYIAPLLRADGSQIVASITAVLVSTDDTKQFRILTLRPHMGDPATTRTESAGHIKLVGLEAVRAAMGDRWQAVAERAMATAEAIIRRRCGDQDSFARVDETSFLMCFGTLSEREASFRAAVIGREIRDRLIGQGDDPNSAQVRSIAAEIRFSDHGETAASLHAILLSGLDSQLERLEREARQTLQSAITGVACDLERISGRNAAETVATRVVLPREIERDVISALAVLPAEETKAFDMDGLLLGLAAQQALNAMARGDATPFLVSVRFDVFATRAATERYLATCMKIDKRVSSHLLLLLSSPPRGLPKTRLLECVNRLRPFCHDVGYQVDDVASLASIDLSFSHEPIVSLPVTVLAEHELERLMGLIGSMHARRAKVLIRDVVSEEDAASSRTIGADLIAMRGPGR